MSSFDFRIKCILIIEERLFCYLIMEQQNHTAESIVELLKHFQGRSRRISSAISHRWPMASQAVRNNLRSRGFWEVRSGQRNLQHAVS